MKKYQKALSLFLLCFLVGILLPASIPGLPFQTEAVAATTKLPKPATLTATATGTTSATIQWSPVSGASGYRLYRKQIGVDTKWVRIQILSGTKNTSYIDNELSTGRTYSYTVLAYQKVNGEKVLGKYDKTGVSITTKMTTPKLVSLTESDSKTTTLTWKSTPGVDGYKIYRKTSGKSWSCIKTLKGDKKTSYKHESPANGITYYYTVKAYTLVDGKYILSGYNKTGLSITIKTPLINNLTFTELSSTSLQISWSAQKNVDGYRIYRKTASDKAYTRLKTTSDPSITSYTDTGLEMGRTYYYVVRGYKNVNGDKVWGYYDKKGIAAATKIPQPTLVSASAIDHSSILVKWKKVTGADGYRIYRKAPNETSWTRLLIRSGATKVTFTDTGLNPDTKYAYTIIAYKKIDDKNVLSKYDKTGVSATTKEKAFTFENGEVILLKGETRTLTFNEGTVTSWKSSDSSIVSVVNGSVSAHKAGKARITAAANGKKYTCDIIVENPSLPETFAVTAGKKKTLTLKNTSEKVTWTVYENNDNLTLTASGNNSAVITGLKPGTVYVVAQIKGHAQKFQCQIRIDGYIKAEKTSVTLYQGERTDVDITTNYNKVYLSSSNTAVASCYHSDYTNADYAATIYGASAGTTTIRIASASASAEDEPAVYVDITVTVLKKETDKTASDKLIDYLKRNGTFENGSYTLKLRRYCDWVDEPYYESYSVSYQTSTNTFNFYSGIQKENSLEEITMNMLPEQTSNIAVYYQYTSANKSFKAKATIRTSTFTGANVAFTKQEATGFSNKECTSLLAAAENSFPGTFRNWSFYLLSANANVTMKNLGFSKYTG